MNTMEILKQGGTGGALAYLLLTVPTDWLGFLPVVPEAHYLPMVGALGTVITGAMRIAGIGNGKAPVKPEPSTDA